MCVGCVTLEMENYMRQIIHYSAEKTLQPDSDTLQMEVVSKASDEQNSAQESSAGGVAHDTRRQTVKSHTDIHQSIWKEYQDNQGRTYYYNTVTKRTQWEAPEAQRNAGAATDADLSVDGVEI